MVSDPFSHSHVAILLGTYNGSSFLSEQLNSYANQSHQNWSLHVSDDGSTDDTLSLISKFKQQNPHWEITFREGPRKGFSLNFLFLLSTLEREAAAYAFSDQDDIWEPEKLNRALSWLSTIPKNVPALYGTRTHLVDTEGYSLGFSPLFQRPPSFPNALVQNMAGGNTLVMNHAARILLKKAGTPTVPSHDWWSYLTITACGGICFYDSLPTLRYRQHGANLVGKNRGIRARLKRAYQLLQGKLKENLTQNLQALDALKEDITPENHALLLEFENMRASSLFRRLQKWPSLGIYRQSALDDKALFLALCLGKI